MPTYSWALEQDYTFFVVEDGPVADLYHFNCAGDDAFFGGTYEAKDLPNVFARKRRVPATLVPGQFHSRIWRGQMKAEAQAFGLEEEQRDSVRMGRILATKLQEIFRYVEPTPHHNSVYSHELRSLLILACTEVENSCKAVLKANNAKPAKKKKDFNMRDYERLAGPMKLAEWEVVLTTCPKYGRIQPFAAWAVPGTPLSWYQAYNDTKHDRDLRLCEATFRRTIEAVAGAFVLNVAQFGYASRERYAYFSPDEFTFAKTPKWSDDERYVPPVMPARQNGLSPKIPLGRTWTHVDCPL
jgi:hypothetical protein